GTLIALIVSPILGVIAAFVLIRVLTFGFRRATSRFRGPVNSGQWVASAALAFSHGANDAQKAVGVIAALLLATGNTSTLSAPTWAVVGCSAALTLGTALGGWKIVKTIGRRIFKIGPLDGFASQTGSTAVILGASFLGAPISTTHVVASSIIGIGAGRNRFRHVRWGIVKEMLIAWATTIPGTAALAALTLVLWRSIA
ncbi:MAG: inorganic phosphate transporter, partial [Gaiella sp.]